MGAVTEKLRWRPRRGRHRPEARHGWQRAQPESMGTGGPNRLGRRVRIAAWLAVFLIAMGLFIHFVLFSPIQSPVIAVVGGPYQWPYPPNAWAREDLDGLSALDGKTLAVIDASPAWRSIEEGLRAVESELRAAREQAIASGVVVLSISMHGAVDATGAPCLIPAGAAPHDARTWLPVRRLLDVVRQSDLPPRVHKLVILDAGRMRVNWNIGVLENSFAEGLDEVVSEAAIPNLVVLNSTGAGERGWSSSELQGSVFGYYLRRALAGAADGALKDESANGRVSLHELHAYLRKNVDAWVRSHRGARQQPRLIPSTAEDFAVAWSLGGLSRESAGATNETRTEGAVNSADVMRLWRRRDALPARRLERFDPIRWHRLQHDLLWLERAVAAGRAYEMPARQSYVELKGQLAHLATSLPGDQKESPRTSETRIRTATDAGAEEQVHHLPLAAVLNEGLGDWSSGFGHSDDQAVQAAREMLAKLQTPATMDTLNTALRSLADKKELRGFDQIHFARLVSRHRIPQLWQTPGMMASIFTVREQAVRAAIPADERVQYWTATPLASADVARRAAEDLLFLGPDAARDDPTVVWKAVAKSYAGIEQFSEEVTESLRIRDRAWARVPYLAKWLTHPLHENESARELEETLLPLIENLHQLSRVLAAGPGDADPHSVRLSQITTEVRQQLARVEQEFQSALRASIKAQPSAASCREIIALLDVPLPTAEQREQLRQKLGNVSDRATGAGRTTGSQPGASHREAMAALSTHPALAMLDRHWLAIANFEEARDPADKAKRTKKADQAEKGTRNTNAGARVRVLLGTLPEELLAWRERLSNPPEDGQRRTFPFRAGWPQAELARIAASFSLPRLESDPIERLRRLDLQRLLLRTSRRVLDDFYGPGTAGERPFFEIAAEDYLRAAETIIEPTPASDRRLSALRTLLEDRRRAAQTALRTDGHPILVVDPSAEVATHLLVQPREAGANLGLPSGRAAVFLRDERGRIDGSSHPLDVPLANNRPVELDADVSGASFTGRGPELSAVTLFRGNEFGSTVPIDSAGGYRVERTFETHDSASVMLSGSARKHLAVVFVLDCSSSMSAAVQVEAPRDGKQPAQTTRMAVAKDALTAMLDQLALRDRARVGVLFYGHRVGWSTAEPIRILRQADYARTIPESLSPNRDVEAIQHLGRFDSGIAAEIEGLLASIKPWGQTPLYYALTEALGEFAGEHPDTEPIIIVITDGLNYQFNDPDPTTLSDVLAAWSGKQVPIYIVGFGIPAEDADEAYNQFTRLAKQTGGDYRTPAVNATSLIKSLESLLSPGRYRILGGDGRRVGAAELGDAITIDSLDAGRRASAGAPGDDGKSFVVEIDAARQPITLWGGEALRLRLDQSLNRIRSATYNEGRPQFVDLVTGTPPRPSGLGLGVHRPRRESGGALFTISLQRADHDFTPRPAESWIEITPIFSSERKTGRPVDFYHPRFEPGKPVPVLNWRIGGWPSGADRATIRFWCKPARTEPTATIEAASLVDDAPGGKGALSDPALKGIVLTAHPMEDNSSGGAVLQVIEQHSPQAGFEPLKIAAILGKKSPARMTRRIDPEHRFVVHRFRFDGVGVNDLRSVQLRITTRAQLRQDAWDSEEAVEVEISDVSGLIAPSEQTEVLRPRLQVK